MSLRLRIGNDGQTWLVGLVALLLFSLLFLCLLFLLLFFLLLFLFLLFLFLLFLFFLFLFFLFLFLFLFFFPSIFFLGWRAGLGVRNFAPSFSFSCWCFFPRSSLIRLTMKLLHMDKAAFVFTLRALEPPYYGGHQLLFLVQPNCVCTWSSWHT